MVRYLIPAVILASLMVVAVYATTSISMIWLLPIFSFSGSFFLLLMSIRGARAISDH